MHLSLKLFVVSICLVGASARAQQFFGSLPGPVTGGAFGAAVIDIGDKNGDTFRDYLVGAPWTNNNSGMVYAVSGAYLATGTGPSILWQVDPSGWGGGYFGISLANVGDVTGDGVADFAVGAPLYDIYTFGVDEGCIYLINGATHNIVSRILGGDGHYSVDANRHFGWSLATVGDITGDGKAELAVGMPGDGSNSGGVYVLPGSALATNGGYAPLISIGGAGSGASFGTSLASGFDLNGDGLNDIAVGAPAMPAFGTGVLQGWVFVISAAGSNVSLGNYKSSFDGDRLGASVSALSDYDGDGKVDIVAGAPEWIGSNGSHYGRTVVLSGSKLLTNSTPKELYTLDGGFLNNAITIFQTLDAHFGTAVNACADLNDDGVGDFLVGAPDYRSVFPSSPVRGSVTIYSGANGMRIGGLVGSNYDRIGDALLGATQDVDGDGFRDLIVAGSTSDNPVTDCGVVKSFGLYPNYPSTYCSGKINSLGCTPTMSSVGLSSASSNTTFLVVGSNFINQKTGLLLYSDRPAATPFQGGTLCVKSPTIRTAPQNSGGSASGSDCSGSFSYDFEARISSGIDPRLGAGAEVFCQYWARDPAVASGTSLSNALHFLVQP